MNRTKWPADKVERRNISTLIPFARNARTHSEKQVAQVAASMKEWGWTNPVLIDETGGIIAGHCRVLAARQLGISEIPVMVAEGWSEAQKQAYVIADNQLTLNAGWDMEMLANEVRGLDEWKFDLSLLGFENLDALLAEEERDGLGVGDGAGSLAEKFGVPPFSVLNAREGWWQDRKAAWIALGIKSELGRGGDSINDAAPAGRKDCARGRAWAQSKQRSGGGQRAP